MLLYFWKFREKPPFLSKQWAKVWLKRIHSAPALFKQAWQIRCLQFRGAQVGNRSFIVDHSRVIGKADFLSIGNSTFVGRAIIAAHAKITIGSNVCINDGVKLLTASHDVGDKEWRQFSKNIVIEDYAWIATDAIILPGVRIGRGAVVGAAAVVAKDVPAYSIVVGNPAHLTLKKRPQDLNYNPTTFLAVCRAWLGPDVNNLL